MLSTYECTEPHEPAGPDPASVLPKGPTGLWGALVSVSTPSVADRALPLSDPATFGVAASMFDYDPERAISLGFDLDELLSADS